ncbi:hypothetical protein ACFL96_16365, partial [Thermoproteota archaeon]
LTVILQSISNGTSLDMFLAKNNNWLNSNQISQESIEETGASNTIEVNTDSSSDPLGYSDLLTNWQKALYNSNPFQLSDDVKAKLYPNREVAQAV